MKILIILILFFITNCSLNKVSNTHGNKLLTAKSNNIFIGKSNSNDILDVLGPPSTKSEFNNNIWYYIERKRVSQSIFKLGKVKTISNNVLVVEFDNRGLLKEKKLYNLEDMKKIKFTQSTTKKKYEKDTYLYNLLTSLREKINSPTRKKKGK